MVKVERIAYNQYYVKQAARVLLVFSLATSERRLCSRLAR